MKPFVQRLVYTGKDRNHEIVQVGSLVYSRCGETMRKWIDSMAADWDFKQIVPAHFSAPFPCTGKDLISAFQRSTTVYEPIEGDEAVERSNGGDAGAMTTSSNPGTFRFTILPRLLCECTSFLPTTRDEACLK